MMQPFLDEIIPCQNDYAISSKVKAGSRLLRLSSLIWAMFGMARSQLWLRAFFIFGLTIFGATGGAF